MRSDTSELPAEAVFLCDRNGCENSTSIPLAPSAEGYQLPNAVASYQLIEHHGWVLFGDKQYCGTTCLKKERQ